MIAPSISIIVPCYNCINTIERCVNSLLSSQNVSYEIILADDGSTDGTAAICKRFESSYPQVIYLPLSHKGVAAARNAGLTVAKGNYIGFTDSDDYVEPNMFSNLLSSIVSSGSVISVCGFFRESGDRKETISYTDSHSVSFTEFRSALFTDEKTEGFLCNKLFRANLIKNLPFHEDLSVCEDLCFISDITPPSDATVSYCPGAFYHYIQSDVSSTRGGSMFENGYFRYAPAFRYLKETAESNSIKRVVLQKYYHILRHTMREILKNGLGSRGHSQTDIKELKLIQKELRHSIANIFPALESINEKRSLLKAAFYPLSALIQEYDIKHGIRRRL